MRRVKHSGIYKITHTPSSTIYIGKSVDIFNRWQSHLTDLFYNRHGNPTLQKLFDDGRQLGVHSYDDFTFSIIKLCKKTEIGTWEKQIIAENVAIYGLNRQSHLIANVIGNPARAKVKKVEKRQGCQEEAVKTKKVRQPKVQKVLPKETI